MNHFFEDCSWLAADVSKPLIYFISVVDDVANKFNHEPDRPTQNEDGKENAGKS